MPLIEDLSPWSERVLSQESLDTMYADRVAAVYDGGRHRRRHRLRHGLVDRPRHRPGQALKESIEDYVHDGVVGA